MASKDTSKHKLYAPTGTVVEVTGKARADQLKKRGYTTTKPKSDGDSGSSK